MSCGAAWAVDKSRSISERLLDSGAIDETQRTLLESMIEQAVKAHGEALRKPCSPWVAMKWSSRVSAPQWFRYDLRRGPPHPTPHRPPSTGPQRARMKKTWSRRSMRGGTRTVARTG